MASVNPNQVNINTMLRGFLLDVLPEGVEVVLGQVNRVPEPSVSDFVIMWPLRRVRLATNVDTSADVKFIAEINGKILTVTSVDFGTLAVGQFVFGVGIAAGTKITSFLSGVGGIGAYSLNIPNTFALGVLSTGHTQAMQETEVCMQLDVHGPNSSDNVQIITTLFRDDYGVQKFLASGLPITPLYTEDPRQIPFINDQDQVETRWVIEAYMQADQTVIVGQQYADSVVVGLIDVDVVYPP